MNVTQRRLAGMLIPLFSVRSPSDWGVGELPDLARLGPVLERGGFSLVMTLPLLEPSPGQESPYSPVSAFALDPLYVSLDEVEDMQALGGRAALSETDRAELSAARGAASVRPELVRPLKERWLRRCFERFRDAMRHASREAFQDGVHDGAFAERAEDFERFRREHAFWLPDYALFRTLKDHHPQSWREWPDALREARPDAVEAARVAHEDEIERREYVQWIAFRQLQRARAALRRADIFIGGDEPFLVADDSADVWANQARYRFDATVGAPPDAFSATGQDWGLPPYNWDRIAEEDYEPFRQRGVHAGRLFDVVRIDHVVGLYRTYHRPVDGSECFFVPNEQPAQLAQGEAVLHALSEGGAALIAEDLGVIPDFVRSSLERASIPGYRVLRWEERGGRYRPPSSWPELSVATNGTHDTETTAVWWEALTDDERAVIREIPTLGAIPDDLAVYYDRDVHEALHALLYESPSRLALLPIQDIFGLRERINIPNTVGPHNWSWRLPWSLDTMERETHVVRQLEALSALAARTGRSSASPRHGDRPPSSSPSSPPQTREG